MKQLKIGKSITPREGASLEHYLQEIGRVELLNIDEEVALAQLIRKGDSKALDALALANLRFVVSVAKQYQNQGLPLPDLINEGNLGLMKAAERFDETRGFKFISYAVWWIRQSILQALAEQGRNIRLPLNQVGLQGKINKAISSFEQEFERRPSADELAELFELSVEKVRENIMANGKHLSIDAPFTEGEENTLNDVLPDEDSEMADQHMMNESLSQEIERALNTLSPREKDVVKMAFGLNGHEKSLEEIGEQLGLTRERVRQIREKAIRSLKNNSRNMHLRQFLG